MKATIDRIRFAEAAGWVAKAADPNSTQPIMSGMLLDADASGTVTLAAFDYEMSSRATVPAFVADQGECLVSAVLLHKLLSAADGDEVEVVADDNTVTITCGRDVWDLAPMPSYDYPSLPAPDEPSGWVDAEALTQAFKQVGTAVAKGKGAEIEHTGVFVDAGADVLALAGTNRHRMAATEVKWQQADGAEPCSAIVPPRLLADFTAAATGRVGISFTRGHDDQITMVALTAEGRQSTIRVIAGRYPVWRTYFTGVRRSFQEVRESGGGTALTVETDALLRALKRAAGVIGDVKGVPASVFVELSEDGVTLTGGGVDGRLSRLVSQVDGRVSGEGVRLKINLTYLIDAFAGLRYELAEVSVTSATKPVLIRPANEELTHQYLVQPLRA